MNNTETPLSFEEQRKPQISPQEPYHFSPDELRVLKECNRESFYQRSLPAGTFLGLSTFYAVKSGYLKGSVRWGATPKVFMAVVAGYFLGKFSYQSRCAEKMMQLPNSPLGEMLRKRRQHSGGASFSDSFGLETTLTPSLPSLSSSASESFEVYSDHGPRSMDLDITRPMQDGIDARPNIGDAFLEEEPLPAAQSNTTYEELRRQNREDYEKRRSRAVPGLEDPPNIVRARLPTPSSTPAGDKNQYGDAWEG